MNGQQSEKLHKIRVFWRIVTTIACALMLVFIFSNSLKTAEVSSTQSSKVVDTVQEVVSAINPESPIATATGEDYDRLHAAIREMAHFFEFALLGALFCLCWFSYTSEKGYVIIPATAIVITPMIDELLQTLSSGRAAEWFDVFVDVSGGFCGGFLALCAITIGVHIYRKRAEKRANSAKVNSATKR